MKSFSILGVLAPCGLLAAFVVGCASSPPPKELVDARAAYNRASSGQAAQLDPAALHAAQTTLQAAEKAYDDKGDSEETRDLAYVALRKVQLADANAEIKHAGEQVQLTQAQLQRNQASQLMQTQQQLSAQGQQLAAERARAEEAEKRAQQAAADLAKIAAVKQEPRGMVITLSGSVLFASNKSALLPAAQSKLNEVANALSKQDPESKITVEGYTDSTGPASLNEELSQKRADAVRTFLVSHGIASDRIDAVGKGPADPVADNTTAEGRANNRRVEIVVKPAQNAGNGNGSGSTGPSTTK